MKTLSIAIVFIYLSFRSLNAQDLVASAPDVAKKSRFEKQNTNSQISAQLFQSPSLPHDETGFINYEISGNFKDAAILIFDNKDHLVKQYQIEEAGVGNVTLYSSTLNQGVYHYALMINGSIVESRTITIIR